MTRTWQLQRAKAEFSKLIDMSIEEGPQIVTRHGRPTAVVMSTAEYRKLKGREPDFRTFLRKAPLYQVDLSRNRDRGRKVEL
jgi:prevent-host-death family protein